MPGTAGFASECLVLSGAFRSQPRYALVAALGVICAAYSMLPMVQRMLFNPVNPANRGLPDLNARELGLLAPLVVLIILLGFFPKPFLDRMEPAARKVLEMTNTSRVAPTFGAVAAAPGER